MPEIKIPGTFWVALIAAIIPLFQLYFKDYAWTAGLVVVLGAVSKLVEIYLTSRKDEPLTRGSESIAIDKPKGNAVGHFFFD